MQACALLYSLLSPAGKESGALACFTVTDEGSSLTGTGGIGTVRGFTQSSLGPRDPVDNVPLGGQTRIVGSAEFIFPLPGTGSDRSFRSFVFFDVGNVYPVGSIDLGALRAGTGLGLNWASPIGPMKISMGFPVRSMTGDRVQRIQFQVGSGF